MELKGNQSRNAGQSATGLISCNRFLTDTLILRIKYKFKKANAPLLKGVRLVFFFSYFCAVNVVIILFRSSSA